MSPEIAGLIGLVILLALIFSGMWIGTAMAMIGFLGYIYIIGIDAAFAVIAQTPFRTIYFYPITAVPLFLLMGVVISNTGMGEDLYNTADKWVGHMRGGLAIATVLACALLAAITGVSAASVVAMGKVALPEMRKHNYDEALSTGCIACASTLAVLIPPSMTFIMYGILTENSVGVLFMSGFLPGILLAILFIIAILIVTTKNPAKGPPGPKTTFKEKVVSLKGTWHMVILFLVVLGGIYTGVFTPTEAAAIGAFGAIIIAIAGRRLSFRGLVDSLLESGKTTAMVMLMIIGAFIFMKFVAVSRIAIVLSDAVSALGVDRMVVFAGIILMYIILGMFFEVVSGVVLTIPIIYPMILALGFNPIWFGVIIVLIVEMGVVTPPVGLNVFLLAGVVDTPTYTIFRGVTPFVIMILICIIILTIFPQIALWLPSTM